MSAQGLRLLTVENAASPADRQRWSKRLLQFGGAAAGLLLLAGVLRDATFGIWNALISPDQIANFANQKAAGDAFSLGALRAGVLVLALVFAIRKWLLREANERFFALALAAVVAAALYWVGSRFIDTYEFERMYPREAAVDQLKADTSAFRVYGLPGAYQKGYAQYHLLASADSWLDQEYKAYRAYRGGDYNRNPYFMEGLRQNADGSVEGSTFLDMLNVKYFLYRLPDYPGLRIAENKSALPRAWFVDRVENMALDAQLDKMRAADFDPRQIALVEGFSQSPPPNDSIAPKTEIHREEYRNNFLRYRVKTDTEGLLVISEVWFPYWQLQVDGKDQELLRANYLFRGVHLGPGEHVVEMRYASKPLGQALWVSLIAALGLGILCFAWAKTGRKDPPAAA
jgi:hypothetical protein